MEQVENKEVEKQEGASVEKNEVAENTEKLNISIDELLKTNKDFASEYDRRVSKAIQTAVENKKKEFENAFNSQKETLEKQYSERANQIMSEYEAKSNEFSKERLTYETKILALGKGVKSESLDDLITLSSKYVNEETPIEKAIESVISKYPEFTSRNESQATITRIGKEITNAKASGRTLAEEWLEKRKK